DLTICEDTTVRPGDQFTRRRLPQNKDVTAIEAIVHLLPRGAGIVRNEHSAEFFVIDEASVEGGTVIAVHEKGRDLPMSKPAVRSNKTLSGIGAAQDAAAVGRDHHM